MINKKLSYFIKIFNKRLLLGVLSRNGRNTFGRICVFHRGGGNIFRYRPIDFHRRLNNFVIVLDIFYDPNRTSFLASVFCENAFYFNIILTDKVSIGTRLFLGEVPFFFKKKNYNEDLYTLGYSLPIKIYPIFSIVNNIENRPFFGSVLARAAGVGFTIVSISKTFITLKSKSGWLINVSPDCICSLGFTSNPLWKYITVKKAGKNRNLGKRPIVRGVAMNPCDHPHGGGEGKKGTPKVQRNPWGQLTKGPHTKIKKRDKIKRSLFKKLR